MAKLWTRMDSSTEVSPTLYADGTPITNYTIKGRTLQNGTPTESNPVELLGVGILGKNLYNFRAGAYQTGVRYNSSGEVESNENYSILTIGVSTLSSGTYTFSLNSASSSTTTLRVVGFKNGVKVAVIAATQLVNMPLSITVTNDYDEIRFSVASGYVDRIMLNAGQTALPYEPYGYYLPVTSGGVVTNIPISTIQTTRAIKKLVLDGTEGWGKAGSGDTAYFSLNVGDSRGSSCLCSHFVNVSITSENTDIGIRLSGGSRDIRIRPTDVANTDETAFKAWLAVQYTNGTPVTVLYLREEAINTISNEPLYSISASYDNLYYTQSQVSIPTTVGENSITFLTDVQPTRFELPIEGWYFDNPKKWDGSRWV